MATTLTGGTEFIVYKSLEQIMQFMVSNKYNPDVI
jgi:hypothetical protein